MLSLLLIYATQPKVHVYHSSPSELHDVSAAVSKSGITVLSVIAMEALCLSFCSNANYRCIYGVYLAWMKQHFSSPKPASDVPEV